MSAAVGLFPATLAGFLLGWAGGTEIQEAHPVYSPPRHPPLSPDQAENLLRGWLADWAWQSTVREITQPEGAGYCGIRSSRFSNEWDARGTEFRLLVLGYPDLSEDWARRAAENAASPAWERARALYALGILAGAGQRAAETTLLGHCRSLEGPLRSFAILWLAQADRSGRHRESYREWAREGDWAAIEALASWPDPEAVAILRLILGKRVPIIHGYAAESLTRLEALDSEKWNQLAREAILAEPGRVGSRYSWALRIGRERKASWLESTLRIRLNSAGASTLLRLIPPHVMVDDDGFDDALLTLAEIGGTLTGPERAYLWHYGYGCEPRQRLAEVLAERALFR